jgi:predicted lipid-binding transport protein (Tim44 family)
VSLTATAVVTAVLARAGGGNGFSGGGLGRGGGLGGGGFGGRGGGGGFFFFGGGGLGGGGGISVLVVIFLALIIMGVVFRSRRGSSRRWGRRGTDAGSWASGPGDPSNTSGGQSSGGQSSGGQSSTASWAGDDRPAIESVSGDLFPGSHPQASARNEVQAGLDAIVAHDPAFNQEELVDQIQQTFFLVQQAWTERKPELSRRVMADGLWQQHRTQIQGYLDNHTRNVLDGLAVGSVTIVGAHSDQRYDTITSRIIATSADYVVDERGKVKSGHKDLEPWEEDWTFQRSSQATTPEHGGTLAAKCPNCGAPLDLSLSGECRYCKAPVSSGRYDWVLARISQVFA